VQSGFLVNVILHVNHPAILVHERGWGPTASEVYVVAVAPATIDRSAVSYLREVLDVELFPELWRVRTAL